MFLKPSSFAIVSVLPSFPIIEIEVKCVPNETPINTGTVSGSVVILVQKTKINFFGNLTTSWTFSWYRNGELNKWRIEWQVGFRYPKFENILKLQWFIRISWEWYSCSGNKLGLVWWTECPVVILENYKMHRFLYHLHSTLCVKYGNGRAVGIDTHFTGDGTARGRALETVERRFRWGFNDHQCYPG